MPYKYIKDESFDTFNKQVNWGFFTRTRLASTILISLGVMTFATQIVLPIYVFGTQDEVAKPLADSLAGAVSGYKEFEFSELDENSVLNTKRGPNVPQYFYISIPKLKISEAKVETNSPTLNPDKSLGHYAGTALPGETGTTFIYGHSVLPVFYNPRNYKRRSAKNIKGTARH